MRFRERYRKTILNDVWLTERRGTSHWEDQAFFLKRSSRSPAGTEGSLMCRGTINFANGAIEREATALIVGLLAALIHKAQTLAPRKKG